MMEAPRPLLYISCLEEEQELAQVKKLCQWLLASEYSFAFANYGGLAFKPFAGIIAVVGYGYNNASWLNGELHDAWGLSQRTSERRPFLFGLSIKGAVLPRCSEDAPIHWLDMEQSYQQAEESYRKLFLGDL